MAATAVAPRVHVAYQPKSAILDWFTTVDHKKIGILYLWTTLFFFFVGGLLALLVRTQLASPANTFLKPEVYNQTLARNSGVAA